MSDPDNEAGIRPVLRYLRPLSGPGAMPGIPFAAQGASSFAPGNRALMESRFGGELTFAMIKTHAVEAGLTPVVVARILGEDITILCMKQIELISGEIMALYHDHIEKPFFPSLRKSVSGPVVIMALLGPNVIQRWREILGSTNSAMAAERTLRAQWGSRITVADNVAHGSDSQRSAWRELALFFPATINLRQTD